jgi:hypothetical protein
MKKCFLIILLSVLTQTTYSQTLIPKQQGELWGFVDESGQFVIQPKYKRVCEFHHGVAAVVIDQSLGLIDSQGTLITRAIYSSCPLVFGEVAFQPNYRGERQYISWMAHEFDNPYQTQLGVVWVNQQGKVLITQAKRLYNLSDRIPEKLWDY